MKRLGVVVGFVLVAAVGGWACGNGAPECKPGSVQYRSNGGVYDCRQSDGEAPRWVRR